jgi:ubiquinone/menaquinone biosynthesis C-methylase UbiE
MAELVGPNGSLAAFDLAPDNVAWVQRSVAAQPLVCPVEAQVASLTALPYPDESFDAVWCANSLQYLSDEEVPTALAEFRRVVRPGGVIAIKEPDPGLCLFSPGDPFLLSRMWAAASEINAMFRGTLRSRTLRRLLERAGLEQVWQHGTLSEMWAPLSPVQQQYVGRQFMQMGAIAEQVGMPEGDLAFWRRQQDPGAPECLANDPDLLWCEGHFVAVGRVPERAA